MSPDAQRIAIAESCEWIDVHLSVNWGDKIIGTKWAKDTDTYHEVPDYPTDRNAIHAALLHHGIQSHDNPAIRVKFIGHLREIAARRLPRNTVGTSLMSDVDLVTCEASELCEALLKTLKRWKP